ncbi:MAG: Nramp family divalent metal transporter [Gemmatimonadaceae bacterium]
MKAPKFGPGAIVAAAFIGPGTVTTCTLAGVRFGYALLWALAFATLGTIILQEMSARLGVVGRLGLGEAIRRRFDRPDQRSLRLVAILLVVGAIGVGNAAYETGNLLGAALGIELIAEAVAGGRDIAPSLGVWVMAVTVAAGGVLWTGSYRVMERVLVALVIAMSVAFLVTAVAVADNLGPILEGVFVPSLPTGDPVVVLGLIGTTIVPYNLFLHASSARERWRDAGELGVARADLVIAIGLGGIVSMAIVVTAAVQQGASITDAASMAIQLEPMLGRWATIVFAAGLFAAGATSAITAPVAAAYALAGAFGWTIDLRAARLRTIWGAVLLTGTAFAMADVRPVSAILFAQVANGLLLPAVAVFLMIVMNDRRTLGAAANGWVANALGSTVVVLTLLLGIRLVAGALA